MSVESFEKAIRSAIGRTVSDHVVRVIVLAAEVEVLAAKSRAERSREAEIQAAVRAETARCAKVAESYDEFHRSTESARTGIAAAIRATPAREG